MSIPHLILASASPRRLEVLRSLGIEPEIRPADVDETPLPGESPEDLVRRLSRAKVLWVASHEARGAPADPGTALGTIPDGQGRLSGDRDGARSHSPRPPDGSVDVGSARASLLEDLPSDTESSFGPRAPRTSSRCLILGADTAVVLDGEILGKPVDPEDAARMLTRLSGREHEVLSGSALLALPAGRLESGVFVTRVKFARVDPERIARYVASGEPMDKAGGYGIQARAGDFVERIEGSYTNVVGLPVELFGELLGRFALEIADLATGASLRDSPDA